MSIFSEFESKSIIVGDHVLEFESLDALCDLLGDSYISNINQQVSHLYTKKNGYRILVISMDADYPFFNPDMEGLYTPISTFVSHRFKDTKSISTMIYKSEPEYQNFIDEVLEPNQFIAYIGDRYCNIILTNRQTAFHVCESIGIVVIMDMMYDKRKHALEKLMEVIQSDD